MEFTFKGEVIEWRGPAPFYFIATPAKFTADFKAIASSKSYGWGVLYANITLPGEYWKTTLMPKDGCYLIPIKKDIRLKHSFEVGQKVSVTVDFNY
jgi:hypothetical protein